MDILNYVKSELKMLRTNKKGQLQGAVAGLIVLAVSIIIGLIVFSSMETNIDTADLSVDGQTAYNNTVGNTYTSFNLMSNLPLVVVAGVIMFALFSFGGGYVAGRGR